MGLPSAERIAVTPRVVQLDILRFFAVVLVIGHHMNPCPDELTSLGTRIIGWIRQCGWIGVDLFFVLSGFLVSGLLFREHKERKRISIKRFLVRRGLRIYPAFYVLLFATLTLRRWRVEPSAAVSEALFVQNYGPQLWPHTWSLAVEEHFYFILTLLLALMARRMGSDPFRPIGALFVVFAISTLTLRLVTFVLLPYDPKTHTYPTHLRIDALFFGVFLAYLIHHQPQKLEFIARGSRTVRACAMLVCLSLLLPSMLFGVQDLYMGTIGLTLLYVGFGGVLLLSITTAVPQAPIIRWTVGIAAYLGAYSYSIYLWHYPVLVYVIRLRELCTTDVARYYYAELIMYVIGSVLVGIVMAKCVEYPVLTLRDRLFPSRASPLPQGLRIKLCQN